MPAKVAVEYRIFSTGDALARATAEYITSIAREAVAARGVARVAISGGNTPRRAFELLASPSEPFLASMPWHQMELYWVDERCVPPDHPDSNFLMTRQALLDRVPLDPHRIHRIEGELSPEEAAARYESAIRNSFRLEGAQAPVFDLIALGMGPDGHTASLFPHTAAIHEMGRIAVANHVPQQKQSWRVTLTWPVINEARNVFFEIAAQDKAEPLRRVLTGPRDPEELPTQLIRPSRGKLLFLLDQDAASQLPPPRAGSVGHLELA